MVLVVMLMMVMMMILMMTTASNDKNEEEEEEEEEEEGDFDLMYSGIQARSLHAHSPGAHWGWTICLAFPYLSLLYLHPSYHQCMMTSMRT